MKKDLLRFSIIGSVDDGKSSLLGRLLLDSGAIYDDQLKEIEESSRRRGDEYTNLALLTDGLKAEREQGITIDVAYRYFTTKKRKFIVADCPGHSQYVRNMVTGTSTAQVALVLIDVRNGLTEQTRRHSFIASMMGVKHLVVCINKMDLVDYSEESFEKVKNEMSSYLGKLDIQDVQFIPLNSLGGDNIVTKSKKMKWYQGASLLYMLENIHVASDFNFIDCRFPIQKAIRPMNESHRDFRGFAGRIESGVFKEGDEVELLPSNEITKIKKIYQGDKIVSKAFYPMSVVMTLENELDLSRGDMVVRPNNRPDPVKELNVLLCWFSDVELNISKKYYFFHCNKYYQCKVDQLHYVIHIETLHRDSGLKTLKKNDIGRVVLKTNKFVYPDSYRDNRNTGGIIIVDESGDSVAAGILR
jgi:sulfate adenylyltransferase subunit 1